MKRTIALIVLIGSLFVAGIAFFLYTKSVDPTDISLVKEEGKVYVKDDEKSDYKEVASDEQTVKSGSFIKTDVGAYARVFLPDNSLISIDQSSEIQVSYSGNQASIDQLIGKTWHRVQTVTNGGEYKVQTANTIAAVRGTIFAVGFDTDGTSHVSVEESKVNVQSLDTDGTAVEQYDLQPGDRSDIPKNVKDKIKKYLTDDAFKATDWYKRNKLVDSIYEDLKKGGVRNLRTLLRQKLEESSDFDRFHFGLRTPVPSFIKFIRTNILRQPDTNQIRDDLSDLYKLEKITENVCTDIPPQELDKLTNNVQKYKQYVADSDKMLNILTTIKAGCQDKILSVDAAEKLKVLTK
ncbi:MAG: FecR domain-containing protein [Candidatus Dojkabacteria bacterium]